MVSLQYVRQSNVISTASMPVVQQPAGEPSRTQETKVSLTSWLSDDSSSDYPEAVQQYLSQVQNDPSISEQEKNALFFNLVLRPKSEARSGGSLSKDVITKQDSASWKNYLSSLQYLSTLNSKNDKENAGFADGFTISANLDKTDFMPWFELIRHQVSQQSDETGLLPALTSVKAKVNTLKVTDEISFDQVQLQLKPEANFWVVDINSTQTKGQ